ncbi:Carboxylesterase [Hymenopellis radicata]|nr:Carboxylesterase [Hymenopellis radicata]
MRLSTTALVLSQLALFAYGAPSMKSRNRTASASVDIRNGTLNGLHLDELDQDVFLGIPYAKPPVDNLRLRNPQVWDTAFGEEGLNATSYGWSCPQAGPLAIGTGAVEYQSEDCLTLNVVRPDTDHGDLPVLAVWIYGGGYNAGTSSSPVYNLSYIVQESVEMGEPIVAVSFNYRLGALGFLASTEVVASGNANLGLKDQRLALRWIQENIASFGGDPSKVTIWGESAGAYSVHLQSLAYGGIESKTGLFRGGIQESGTAVGSRYDVEHLQATYDDIVNKTGCCSSADTLDCLRSVPYDLFFTVAEPHVLTYTLGPVIDGDFIPDYPSKLVQSGQFDRSIIGLVGANTDEGASSFFSWVGVDKIDTDEQFYDLLTNSTANKRNISVDTANGLFKLYPSDPALGSPYGTGDGGVNFTEHGLQFKRSASFAGDMEMIAPRRHQCETMTQWSSTAYSFRFNTRPERIPAAITGDITSSVTHYHEIPFVFGNPANLTDTYETSLGTDLAVVAVSKSTMRAWISFVNHLNPNHVLSGLPYWPSYGESPVNMVFDAGGSFVEPDDFRKEAIAFINARPGDFLR